MRLIVAILCMVSYMVSMSAYAVEKDPVSVLQEADGHLKLAQEYAEAKRENPAIEEFKSAINMSTDELVLVSAHLGLAAIYKRRGEAVKADEEYELARKIFPGVDEMIKDAEINSITPKPRYCGDEFNEEDGMHPKLEVRARRANDEMKKKPGRRYDDLQGI